MRKVFLDNLPRKGKFVDWQKSVGYKVKFYYEDIESEVEIVDYNKGHLKIKYADNIFPINISNFSRCVLGTVLGKYKFTKIYKYEIGEIIDNVNSGKLKILEQIKRGIGAKNKNGRFYKYECLICGHKDTILEAAIVNKGCGCGVCDNKKVIAGINDIWTTDPIMGQKLWNPEDGYKYTSGSRKRVDFKCLECGEKIDNKPIYSIRKQGLCCPRCSDGISYPEKLMYNILRQTNTDFKTEYSPEWAIVVGHENERLNGRKFYDFTCDFYNFTIEMHGSQHYQDTRRDGARTSDEEQKNDLLKENLHKEHSSKEYIIIKSSTSELEYIKQNILDSKLVDLIDLTQVDWEKADRDSQKSFVKIACDYFNSGDISTTQIGEIMNLNKTTVIRYLKRGSKLGWCNYNPKMEAKKSRIKGNSISAEKSKKIVLQFSLDGNLLSTFNSGKEASQILKIGPSLISAACLGRQKTAGGFKWIYKEDYEKRK